MADLAAERAPGWYWVRWEDEWLPIENVGLGDWQVFDESGTYICVSDSHFTEIGPRIPSPDDPPNGTPPAEARGLGSDLDAAVTWAQKEAADHRKTAERHDADGRHNSAGLFLRDAKHLDALVHAALRAPGEAERREVEVRAIEGLLQLAYAAWCAADDSEEMQDGTHVIDGENFQAVCKALDALNELPDDQPGYTMGEAAKARWALRRLLPSSPSLALPRREDG